MPDLDIILKILEIVAVVGGGFLFFISLGRSIEATNQTIKALRDVVLGQGAEIKELRVEMKQFTTLLTQVAVQKERIDTISSRIQLLDQRLEELRHGEGFVFPLTRSAKEV